MAKGDASGKDESVTGGSESKEAPDRIDSDAARDHALLGLRRRWVGGGDDLTDLAGGRIADTPLTIHDLDGRALFFDFEVVGDDGMLGTVQASASREIGPAVLATRVGERRWDPEVATREATAAVKSEYKGQRVKVTGTELVCYCWPKIGVRVDFTAPQLGDRSVIYDVADLLPIQRYGVDQKEGSTAYSFYAEQVQPSLERRRRRWGHEEEDLDLIRRAAPELLDDGFTIREEVRAGLAEKLLERLHLERLVLTHQQTVRFGPRCSPHECMELYAQQTDVFCAVATGQMVLDFHRWHFTQNQIAATMGTDASGTSQQGQIDGYQGRSNGCLVATFDGTADFAEAAAEIDANRPFKSGIPGHARCGAGYEWTWSFAKFGFNRSLKVYDPWPWNADICQGGAITWEDWDTVDHTNFIYVRHQTTTH